ncbi:MAG: HAMP domain-containing protein [Chloroflexi bacterium]|nr:HAMP domain-containing protein [Chloroflexota bacterium]
MMKTRLRSFLALLPPRLTTRIMLGMIAIVILAGLVTTLAINQILARSLRQELDNSGRAIALALGESLANPLLQGNLVSVQETLNNTLTANPDVVYIFAYGPHTPIVHTFPEGFPRDLLRLLVLPGASNRTPILLQTEMGIVRDFVVRPLDGVPAEIHLGISENRILAEQRAVTLVFLGLTALGCVLAAGMTYGFSRLATHPLVEFTQRVQRLGQGKLDERIPISSNDEIGELAQAFNAMADEIQSAIHRLSASEAGYRILLTAASDVGEGIALITDAGSAAGTLLFVNKTFARLVGYNASDLIGMNVASVLHPYSVETAYEMWQAIRSGAQHSGASKLVLTSRGGEHRVIETASTRIEYQGQPALAWFTRDITERKSKERELRLRNRELAALNAVAAALSEPFSSDFLQRGFHEALQALELSIGWVTLISADGKSEIAVQEGLEALSLKSAFPACICGKVFHSGRAALVDVNKHCTLQALRAASNGKKLRHATVPLRARGGALGVLSAAFEVSHPFDEYNLRLLSAIGRQMGVALENARLWEELREKEQLRSELLARSLAAQEGERQRIARELHDATGQSLNAMLFGLKAAEAALASDPAQARSVIERLKSAASDTVRELQGIIYDLRPSLLDDLGLLPALRWYAETRLEENGIRVLWHVTGAERCLPSEVETALFHIAQEAMTNMVKYARAKQARIEFAFERRQVALHISDDGQGFDLEGVLAQRLQDGRGLGLLGMRERAELLGGRLEVRAEAGRGTSIRVQLPLSEVQEVASDE